MTLREKQAMYGPEDSVHFICMGWNGRTRRLGNHDTHGFTNAQLEGLDLRQSKQKIPQFGDRTTYVHVIALPRLLGWCLTCEFAPSTPFSHSMRGSSCETSINPCTGI